ncbi:hypothetical protein ETD86_36330 [Nonomuraea turkmeniaca]|uniref:Uncharacterized protein n=1 Tax=Nonomuraea turkmeniaca TaxID=103838 RepID=A0A5S4F5A9_9ACTN|nr:hypothetical protein [Nonomuraea turkmeniaca]TMR11254.1 hypothetical protein ETD86_36330 [Nonomuraea turkmeniaca]
MQMKGWETFTPASVLSNWTWMSERTELDPLALERSASFGKHCAGVLADIGSDSALDQLHRIAQRAIPGLRQTAEETLAWAAKRRGLTFDEAAD